MSTIMMSQDKDTLLVDSVALMPISPMIQMAKSAKAERGGCGRPKDRPDGSIA